MLVRAAGRKAHHKAIPNKIQQTQLPFLYPPGICLSSRPFRCRQLGTESAPANSGPRRTNFGQDSSAKPARRFLATVVDTASFSDSIPFEGLHVQSGGYQQHPPGLWFEPNKYDPKNTLKLAEATEQGDPYIRRGTTGVSGSLNEVTSTFEACLQVGKLERAAVILKRLARQPQVTEDVMVRLHNKYLKTALEHAVLHGTDTQELHKWFEMEIRSNGVQQNAETVAIMLKTSLQCQDAKRRNRLVQRYMDMAKGDAGLEVLGLDVLTGEELNSINHICPTYNLAQALRYEEDPEPEETLSTPDQAEVASETAKEPCPEVLSAVLKGPGLKTLKKSLSIFSDLPSLGIDITSMTRAEQRDVQMRLEEDAVTCAVDRWREESAHLSRMGLNPRLESRSLGARMWEWQEALEERIKKELDAIRKAEKKTGPRSSADEERCTYGPYLELVSSEKLAAITILTTMNSLGIRGCDRGLTLSRLILDLGQSIEEESMCGKLQKTKGVHSNRFDSKSGMTRRKLRFLQCGLLHPGSPTSSETKTSINSLPSNLLQVWPLANKAKVGACLMGLLIEVAKLPVKLEHSATGDEVTQMQPAFSHAVQYKQGKKVGVVMPHTSLTGLMKVEPVHSLLAKHLPMLVEPAQWTRFDDGGFLSHPAQMMRIKNGDQYQKAYIDAAIDQGNMAATFAGLDVLGKMPWRINGPLFDVMLEAWNTGEAVTNFPAVNPNMPFPPEPDANADPLEKRRWLRDVKQIENAKAGQHSQRAFQNFQLEIARALRNEQFYFPHNVDFRGRAYPIPPYLNHMGADHSRGLLRFADGKELGDEGLKWLKIQLANVFGYDKASLGNREAFAEIHKEDVYDSAMNPLNGKKWWQKAEDPWQCLAACMELKNALESPDPTKFVSSLPIHQDGTCNGLQHYAALGGDAWGAAQVNLEPGEKPADVYSAVANLVNESVAEDSAKGSKMAKFLDGKITRKTVKQTVMTNVYGVTFIGARDQIRKQLIAAHKDLPNDKDLSATLLASYLATKVFSALSAMFHGAHEIQSWLGQCAVIISKSITPEQIRNLESLEPEEIKEEHIEFKSSVIWTTPLQMPIVQPYRKSKSRQVKTSLQRICLSEQKNSHPVNPRKQLQGFPPNFIHSLDASHMLLSALKCNEKGLAFAAVHDSFWTHAADIPTMNEVLRDEFIRLHTDDIIGRLAMEFDARYKDHFALTRVRAGSPAAAALKAHRKKLYGRTGGASSYTAKFKTKELLLERTRLRLLRSSNPDEVEEGKAMETSASIVEKIAGQEDLPVMDSQDSLIQSTLLGSAPGSKAQKTMTDDVDGISEGLDEEDVEDVEEVEKEVEEEEEEMDRFERKTSGTVKRRGSGLKHSWVWLPLKFPATPKKGNFDVTRLKDSKYFFS